jgi:uncharacterized repeat protein (TIGR03803 family)
MNYAQSTGKSLCVGAALVLAMMALAVGTVMAQPPTYAVFYNFDASQSEPSGPSGLLAQGIDGNLYGYSDRGGTSTACKNGCGAIYEITPCQGCTPAVLASFASYDNCGWGLTLGSDNNFYGACQSGGAGYGYVYQFIPNPNGTGPGTLNPLYNFCKNGLPCSDGAIPTSRPIEGRDGNYYLNTIEGGTGTCTNANGVPGCGTVVKLTYGTWDESVVRSFAPDNNLINPSGVLTLGGDGNLYGTTQGGFFTARDFPICPPNCGAVYKITTAGDLTPLHTFTGNPDGATPSNGVMQGTDGNFYGTTEQGGANGLGFVYKATPSGELTTLLKVPPSLFDYSFTTTDAGYGVPRALVQASDRNFYGDARDCTKLGEYGCEYYGGIFEITLEGGASGFSWLHGFEGQNGQPPDGDNPDSKVSHTSGVIYGVTGLGGKYNNGVIYSITLNDVEQPEFCRPQVLAGQAGGTPIGVLGQGFGSSSVVTFGGVQATGVTVNATGTFLTATIPAGAQTGLVEVATGATTLTSLQTFHVLPNITGFGPPSGPVGTAVTITGTGWSPKYSQTIGVTFGSVNAEFTVNSNTQVTAIVPKGAVTAPIYITTAEGTAVSATDFVVTK